MKLAEGVTLYVNGNRYTGELPAKVAKWYGELQKLSAEKKAAKSPKKKIEKKIEAVKE